MNTDFIYKQVYTLAMQKGATDLFARQAAVNALDKYKKNKFTGKFSKVIDSEVSQAVKLSRQDKIGKDATRARSENG